MKKNRVVIAKILVISLLLGVFLVACGKSGNTEWQEKYEAGIQLMSEGDAAGAALAFQAAVKLDVTKAEGYASLAEAYMKEGNLDAAEETLRLGQVRCGENILFSQAKERLAELRAERAAEQTTIVPDKQQEETTEHAGGEEKEKAILDHELFRTHTFFDRTTITRVTFLESLKDAPEAAWDFSKTKDGRVLAWLEGTRLYVAGNGNIYLDEDATRLFNSFSEYSETLRNYKSALQTIDFGNLDTSLLTNMYRIFGDCRQLTELDLSSFDTSSVWSMENLFLNCEKLETIDLTGVDTSNVIWMSGMFSKCRNLKNLDVSGFDTSKVTRMDGMFDRCDKLEELDVTGFNTASVTTMGSMFSGCRELKTLDVSRFDTENVTDMAGMFSACYALTKLDISHFKTENVTTMAHMFSNCRALKEIVFGKFDTSSVTNMENMFIWCSELEGQDISRFDISGLGEGVGNLRVYLGLDRK